MEIIKTALQKSKYLILQKSKYLIFLHLMHVHVHSGIFLWILWVLLMYSYTFISFSIFLFEQREYIWIQRLDCRDVLHCCQVDPIHKSTVHHKNCSRITRRTPGTNIRIINITILSSYIMLMV